MQIVAMKHGSLSIVLAAMQTPKLFLVVAEVAIYRLCISLVNRTYSSLPISVKKICVPCQTVLAFSVSVTVWNTMYISCSQNDCQVPQRQSELVGPNYPNGCR